MHFLIETCYGVDLVVCYVSGKAKQLMLYGENGIHQLCTEELHCITLGGHLGVHKLLHTLELFFLVACYALNYQCFYWCLFNILVH